MALKSYRLKFKKGNKKPRRTGAGDLVVGATGAIVGTAFVTQIAGVLNRF